MKRLIICIIAMFGALEAQNFKTLADLLAYTKAMPEYPDADNTDWTDPDFTSFHRGNLPSLWQRIGLGKKILWNVKNFTKDLDAITQERENKSLMGNFVRAIIPKEEAKFFIWGDVQGALHSFARDLKELRTQDVIDDSFKILNPDYYFIFNGDVIDGSPYILETIDIVVQLMKVNPEQVIYIKGSHESKEHWHNYGLRRELEVRAVGLSDERIPLNGLMNRFFNTLAKGLYIVPREIGATIQVVRISHYGTESIELNEKEFAGAFENLTPGKMTLIKLDNKQKSQKQVVIKSIIKAESRTTNYRPTKGLAKLEEDKGSMAWSQLSAPTGSFRRLYEFFYDAFTVLAVKGPIDDWTLSLFNQDVRDIQGFKESEKYKVVSGSPVKEETKKTEEAQKPAASSEDVAAMKKQLEELSKKLQAQENKPVAPPAVAEAPKPEKVEEKKAEAPAPTEAPKPVKVEEKKAEVAPAPAEVTAKVEEKKAETPAPSVAGSAGELVMGVSLDLTKGAKVLGERLKAGLNLAFDEANAQGGINGTKIHLVLLDDEYTPEKARANIDRIMTEFKTNIMFSPSGSPTVQAYFDLVKDGKLLVLFPNTGAPIFRKSEVKYILHFRPSYVDEGKALVNYAMKEMGASKYAFFYQDDAYGQGALEGGHAALKAAGIGADKFVDIPYKRNDVDFKDQAQKIKDEKPDTILFYSTSIAAKGLINSVGVNVMVGKKLLGLSDLSEDVFRNFVKEKGLKFVTANVVPNPKTSDLPIVKEFRALASKNDTPQDIFTLEAYIIATLFIAEMKKVQGPITPEAIIEQFEKIKNMNFKGLVLNLVPADRALSHTLWLDTGADEWVKQEQEIPSTPEGAPAAAQPAAETKAAEATVPTAAESSDANKPILVGSTMDISKGAKDLNIPIKDVVSLFFNDLNAHGGVDGREIRFTILDDEYEPAKARQNVETLMKNFGIDIFIVPSGTASLQAYIDLVQQGKIAVLFPFSGAPKYRKPDLKYLINFIPSYFEEGRTLAKYAVQQMQAKKIMIFYQDDGQGVIDGARAAFKEIGFNNFFEVPHERNTVRFATQVEKFKKERPDAICFFSGSITSKEFIKQAGSAQLAGVKLLGMSDLVETIFNQFIKSIGLAITVISSFPNPETSTMPIVAQYREFAQKQNGKIDMFGLEGYVYARLFVYLVKQVKGAITKESLIQAAENIKNLDFEGFPLNFDPQTRGLSDTFWLNTGNAEWIMQKIAPASAAPSTAPAESKPEAPAQPAPAIATVTEKKAVEAPAESKVAGAGAGQVAPVSPQGKDEVKNNVIQLGSTLDLSKGLKNQCFAVRDGFNSFFNSFNASGGADGKTVKVTVFDDEYTPENARKNVETLLAQFDVDIIFMPAGSATVNAFLDLVKSGKTLVLFPVTGAPIFRKPDLKYMIHFRPSYYEEGRTLAKYAADTMKADKIMMFYQDDAFGQGLLDGGRAGLKELGFTNCVETPYQRNTVRFAEQVKIFEAEKPDAICFFSTSIAAKEFMKQIGVSKLMSLKLLGDSDLADDVFNQFIKETGLKKVVASALPNPETSTLPIVVQYRDAIKAQDGTLDIFGLEGYVCAKLFTYIIQQIKGMITKEAIIQVAENIKGLDFGGINLNFNPKTRELSDSLWLNTGDPEWNRQQVKPSVI